MRIISGSARGRRLHSPGSPQTNRSIRPTSDRAREALFNIIGHEGIKSTSVLDLFAGTGALGLEALSRGAVSAVFVDKHSSALKLIHRNIVDCGFSSISSVIKRDLLKGLFFFGEKNGTRSELIQGQPYDLVFLDPPYDLGRCEFFLSELQKYGLLKSESLVVYEDRSLHKLPDAVEGLVLCDQRKYGDTGFWFYNRK